jgi:hypothetical protein
MEWYSVVHQKKRFQEESKISSSLLLMPLRPIAPPALKSLLLPRTNPNLPLQRLNTKLRITRPQNRLIRQRRRVRRIRNDVGDRETEVRCDETGHFVFCVAFLGRVVHDWGEGFWVVWVGHCQGCEMWRREEGLRERSYMTRATSSTHVGNRTAKWSTRGPSAHAGENWENAYSCKSCQTCLV